MVIVHSYVSLPEGNRMNWSWPYSLIIFDDSPRYKKEILEMEEIKLWDAAADSCSSVSSH